MEANLKMKDKRVLVTGAGTGIGRGVGLEFAKEGAAVVFHYSQVLSLLFMVSIASTGCAREKVFTIQPFAPGANNPAVRPIIPNARDGDISWWMPLHQLILERNKKGNVDLILIGDSITHGMDQAPVLWTKYFDPRNTVNLGFRGDRTEHVLWRLQHGEVDGIAPKAAMVMIGTNNSNGDAYSAEQIADGIVAICRELRRRLPQTKILLLAIFPRGARPDAQRAKNAKASLLASGIADNKMIFYMDIREKFLTPDGTLTKEIMPDLLHPSEEGYVIWAEAVLPKINELLGRKMQEVKRH